nr:DUF5827 family protein [Halobium salinum]
MPRPKSDFDRLYPCDFYTPAELLEPDTMYSVYEIARLLQGLDVDAELDVGTEEILLDWAIPWVMRNADELVVAEPPSDEEPGYYGLRSEGDLDGAASGTAPTEAEAESASVTAGDDAAAGDDGADDADGGAGTQP